MMATLRSMFVSKKFVAALIGLVAVVATTVLGKLHVNVPDDKVNGFLAMIAVYIFGQGVADHGTNNGVAAAQVAAGVPAAETQASSKPVDTLK